MNLDFENNYNLPASRSGKSKILPSAISCDCSDSFTVELLSADK